MDKKRTCYRNDCKVTVTGFHLEQWKVCKTCKLEITDELYNYNKLKEEKKDAPPADPIDIEYI